MSNLPGIGGIGGGGDSGGGGGDGATVDEVIAAINDGTRTLSPSILNIGDDYTLRQGGNGRLQIFQGADLIQEQDDEGAWITKSVRTGTGSVHLGDLHNNGSGGENVVWTNTDSDIAWFPSWGGLKIDGSQIVEMSDRLHEAMQENEPVGLPSPSGSVDYTARVTASANVAFYNIDIVPSTSSSGRFRWRAEKVDTGKEIAEFYFDAVFVADTPFKIPFKYPLWLADGQSVDVFIYDDDDNLLQVRPGVSDITEPYRKVYYSTYEDFNAINASHVGFVDYNNSTSAPDQTIPADTWTTLNNDGAGASSQETYAARNVTNMLDTSTGNIKFDSLEKGDQVFIRYEFVLTPNTSFQNLEFRSLVGEAGSQYPLGFYSSRLIQGGGTPTPTLNVLSWIYIGDDNTKNGGCFPQIRTSGPSSVRYNGCAISVIKGAK